MKLVKMLGLAAIAAAALMAFAGSASATILTSPSGTQYSGEIAASLKSCTKATMKSFIGEVACEKSTFGGKVESQGAETTASTRVSSLTLTSCDCVVAVLRNGSFEIHTDSASANGNGTVTGNGQEFTMECEGFHCIFTTSNTDLGTLTGGTSGVLTVNATIPRTGGRSGAFCGSSGNFVGTWSVNTPSTLLID